MIHCADTDNAFIEPLLTDAADSTNVGFDARAGGWSGFALGCANSFFVNDGEIDMWKLKVIVLTMLNPTIAMSDGIAVEADYFAECSVPGSGPKEINECYFAVGDEVEREMVQAYRLADANLQAFDLENSLESDRSTSALLQEVQIAFENYRKLHCEFPEREALGGSASINATIVCRVELTLSRIEQLTEYASIR